MGSNGLAAVIKYLPTQFTQKMLTLKAARATYIHTVVMDIAIFWTIFFELLVLFTFTLLTLHFIY